MGEVARYPEGTFCWVDLGVGDADGARAFYGELLAWEFTSVPSSEGTYTLAFVDGKEVAGIHSHGDDSPAHWDSYIAVDDVDATTARARELGAEVKLEPFEIPGTARISFVRAPGGAHIAFWQAVGFTGARLVNEPRTWTWNDLAASDAEAEERFYSDLFGWAFDWPVPTYASISMGDLLVGGMQPMDEQTVREPGWFPYFVVEDADRAASEVEDLGGGVLLPPRKVLAGRFLLIRDPLGATSALFEMGPEGPFGGVDRTG